MSTTSTTSIKALPAGTTQLLTLTQVITSPLSAVKELIENSLDARATTISIEISANSLDAIQVRDNGHGIAPDDRGVCCKRHTTSKIRGMDELSEIAGLSLGFRGEALLSLAEVSGGMSVTTRVEGEGAAINLEIGRAGDVGRRSTASHPVGTTVRVTDFFRNLPVRKHNAMKNATRCLASIRRMLQAYALARPTRMSMRVLKTKIERLNFVYAPKGGAASVQDAAMKIVGKDCALQCSWYVIESGGYEVQALFPTPESIPSRISHIGHFLSIDARPVSTSRGTLKQVSKRIWEKMRASSDSMAGLKDPFYAINVVCPQGSYDPNIEPAKDDVLFNHDGALFNAVDELLSAVYPFRLEQQE